MIQRGTCMSIVNSIIQREQAYNFIIMGQKKENNTAIDLRSNG